MFNLKIPEYEPSLLIQTTLDMITESTSIRLISGFEAGENLQISFREIKLIVVLSIN